MKRKTNRLSIPHLEEELKKSRMLSSIAALEIMGKENELRELVEKSPLIKNSCVSDADQWEPLCEEEYKQWNVTYGNGVTLIRARYQNNVKSEHYQMHKETIRVENGEAKFRVNGVNIDMRHGSKVCIPARSHYVCEFSDDTSIVIGIPTKAFKKLT